MKSVQKAYLGAVVVLFLAAIPAFAQAFDLTYDLRIFIFLILLLLNSNHQVRVGRDIFSINFPLLFPILAFFGPAWGMILAALGLVAKDELADPKIIFLFNRASMGLAAGASGAVFLWTGGVDSLVSALLAAAITYSAVNLGLFLGAKLLAGQSDGTFSAVWESVKTILPSFALAALFYYAYELLDVFGVIGGYYVFVTIRSGALFGHLETNYRISLIKSILRAVYAKDQDLMQHLENVAHYSKKLAKRCGYPRWKLPLLDEASYFHDIGKLEISDLILKKPGRLTTNEYDEMKSHPEKGMRFLQEIPLPDTHRELVQNIALYHHERFDGGGYPYGLRGEEIPLEARIVAVADTWEAMTGTRNYREPMTTSEAIAELRRIKGTQLDPSLVNIFIDIVEKDYSLQSHPERPRMAAGIEENPEKGAY